MHYFYCSDAYVASPTVPLRGRVLDLRRIRLLGVVQTAGAGHGSWYLKHICADVTLSPFFRLARLGCGCVLKFGRRPIEAEGKGGVYSMVGGERAWEPPSNTRGIRNTCAQTSHTPLVAAAPWLPCVHSVAPERVAGTLWATAEAARESAPQEDVTAQAPGDVLMHRPYETPGKKQQV